MGRLARLRWFRKVNGAANVCIATASWDREATQIVTFASKKIETGLVSIEMIHNHLHRRARPRLISHSPAS